MTKEKRECMSCRDVLWILVFWGFAVNYMLRNNLNLAIVGMVVPRETSAAASECTGPRNGSAIGAVRHVDHNITASSEASGKSFDDRYHWNEYQQGLALGAYYWLHWVLQLPGGLLARKYGTKMVFGLGNLLVALTGFLIPLAAHYSLNALICLRVIQGLIAGIVWPSMHDMTAKWIPPNERSRFVSSYLGSSVGAAITYPLCAFIIAAYDWEAVFYVTSVVGIVWYGFWLILVYDTPRDHPRISDEERNYIIKSLVESRNDNDDDDDGVVVGDDESRKKRRSKKVPWGAILTSGPFWVTIIAHWGGVWGFITFMTQAPSYFNYVQGWNINATGLLSGSPHVARMLFSYTFSMVADWLLRTKRMSLTGVRKFANLVCVGGQGVLTVGLALSGCEPAYATFFMITGTAINGAVSSATIPVFVELSPNYASVLFGFCNLVTSPAGFISPLVVGLLTNNNQTIGQWRLVFLISAANLGFSAIVHLVWGTAEEQPWNNWKPREKSAKENVEGAHREVRGLIAEKPGSVEDKDNEARDTPTTQRP
ncbi:sialin-like [Copidosoma floridanum]|uniref:sialin-like n=1 Tax=Copidosoma floridanum TaxID=29053 RepID=UPI0006C9C959|nr:sialin-like [Copidosoma floridanum]